MRFAGWLFVGVGVLIVGSMAFVSLQRRGQEYDQAVERASHGTNQIVPPDESGLSRLEAKKTITRRLIDGQLTLLEAAAWFRYLSKATPNGDDEASSPDRNLPEGERYCRQVIRWVGGMLAGTSPSQAAALVRRLEAELDAHKRGDGLILPFADGNTIN